MTRKKFVKQMAARGINRNSAERYARAARIAECPYIDALELFDRIMSSMREAIAIEIKKAFNGAGGGRYE